MANFFLIAEEPTQFTTRKGETRFKQDVGLYQDGKRLPAHVFSRTGSNIDDMYEPDVEYDMTKDFFTVKAVKSNGYDNSILTMDGFAKMPLRNKADKPAKLATAK